MEVILLKDIENLGTKFDVVDVKPGYGRNYLIPQGFAQVANTSNKKHNEEIKKQQSAKIAKLIEDYKALAEKLKATRVIVGSKAGTTGKLFGSVTNIQVAEALKIQFDLSVDRKRVHIVGEVKEVGTYKATVNLYKEVSTEIEFDVVAE
ncbi:MAG TPA: 50S ribosomal protein L9 [Chitinophagales bacterium]|jgi:large subunit ribosomal protein L9|nr:50S ribosomal protein L9 [Chitinophagales bacterium]HQV77788.1 50S ribosomal protein L9 [Chitinophagales bacterium]HQW78262.1 50S ribosomal protein L9 [Chitinophagales bacterium]HRB67578.1 50S ribosomal protein L9 [Chitinophagales bacterium]HRB69985.1 50S ribosomal protein L9 [Chitinophagales bacterium]